MLRSPWFLLTLPLLACAPPHAAPPPSVARAKPPVPAVPTLQLLRELADGRRPMRDVVDARLGVDVAHAGPSNCWEAECPDEGPSKLCTDAELAVAREHIAELVRRIEPGGEPSVGCQNMSCWKHAQFEWDRAETIRFERHRSGTLRLVSVASIDVLLRDAPAVEADEQALRAQLAGLSAQHRAPSIEATRRSQTTSPSAD